MLTRLRFLFFYFLFWIGCFELGRILFLVYQWRNTVRLDAGLIAGILLHGLRMDFAMVCSVILIPVCIVARAGFIPLRDTRRLIAGYTMVVLGMSALATVADIEVFRVWGYRLDASPLHYMSSTREAFASAAGSPLAALALLFFGLFGLGTIVFWRALLPNLSRISRPQQINSVLLLAVLVPSLTVGSWGGPNVRIQMSAGTVYFSRNDFANKATINPVWSFFTSLLVGSTTQTVEEVAEPKVAAAIVDSLLAESPEERSAPARLLRIRPTRIVLLFWESLTTKIVEPTGGMRGITPEITRLSREGLLFDGLYASGSRTTNGLVAVISGLPSHPTANPLQTPEIGAGLPRLSAKVSSAGYETGFFYGGALAFENRIIFLLRGHYDAIVEKRDFDRADWQSPWGVHDSVVLDRVFGALDTARKPFFAVTLTLSSHEPFRVPGKTRIAGDDSEHRFLNAQAYTDEAVGAFVERARRTRWWDSTLIIIVADHGSSYPSTGSPLASAPEQFRIPMLWLGGALAARDSVIHRIGSQSDIAKTLLAQLGIEHKGYRWSKDFVASGSREFAFYAFKDGFGYVDRSGSYVFDNVAKTVISRAGRPTPAAVRSGRAFQQVVMESYADLTARRRH